MRYVPRPENVFHMPSPGFTAISFSVYFAPGANAMLHAQRENIASKYLSTNAYRQSRLHSPGVPATIGLAARVRFAPSSGAALARVAIQQTAPTIRASVEARISVL